jgi:hypothetical protein
MVAPQRATAMGLAAGVLTCSLLGLAAQHQRRQASGGRRLVPRLPMQLRLPPRITGHAVACWAAAALAAVVLGWVVDSAAVCTKL